MERMRAACLWLWPMLGCCLGAQLSVPSTPAATQIYVQLIRGTNETKPPDGNVRPIGPRLSKCLGSVFRWKSYWEVGRQVTTVQPTRAGRVHLDQARDLELAFVSDGQLEARLFKDGVIARKSRFSAQSKGLEIMGGMQGDDNSWFVVVRRDVPQHPAAP